MRSACSEQNRAIACNFIQLDLSDLASKLAILVWLNSGLWVMAAGVLSALLSCILGFSGEPAGLVRRLAAFVPARGRGSNYRTLDRGTSVSISLDCPATI